MFAKKTYKKEEFDHFKFTQFLYNLRQSLGLSQQAMAAKIGCSVSAYTRYEAGRFNRVTTDFVEKVCATFNITRDELIQSNADDIQQTQLYLWLSTPEARPYLLKAYHEYLTDYNNDVSEKAKIAMQNLNKG